LTISAKWASKEVDAYFAVQSQSCLILYESSKEILTDKYPLVFLLTFLFLGKRYSEQDLVDSSPANQARLDWSGTPLLIEKTTFGILVSIFHDNPMSRERRKAEPIQ
jgi:hypothetical protein